MKQLKTRVPALLGPHPKDRHGAGFSRDKEESALDQKGGLWAASGGTEVCDSPTRRQGSGASLCSRARGAQGAGRFERRGKMSSADMQSVTSLRTDRAVAANARGRALDANPRQRSGRATPGPRDACDCVPLPNGCIFYCRFHVSRCRVFGAAIKKFSFRRH